MSISRRTMLPYPSTSRRQCTPARCPRITTIALVSTLFACVYHSRKFLSQEQLSLDRKSDIDNLNLQTAVQVVKEISQQPNIPPLVTHHDNRNALDHISTDQLSTEYDRHEDVDEKQLAGFIPDTKNDSPSHRATDADTVPTVEKDEQHFADDTAQTAERNPVSSSTLDDGATTQEEKFYASEGTLHREVSSSEKQEHVIGAEIAKVEREETDDNQLTVGTVDNNEQVSERHTEMTAATVTDSEKISDKQTQITADVVDAEEKASEKETERAAGTFDGEVKRSDWQTESTAGIVDDNEKLSDEQTGTAADVLNTEEKVSGKEIETASGIVDGRERFTDTHAEKTAGLFEGTAEVPGMHKEMTAGIVDGNEKLSDKQTKVATAVIDNVEALSDKQTEMAADIVDGEEKLSEKQTEMTTGLVDGEEKLPEKEAVKEVEKQEQATAGERVRAVRQRTNEKEVDAVIIDGHDKLSEKEKEEDTDREGLDIDVTEKVEKEEVDEEEDKTFTNDLVDRSNRKEESDDEDALDPQDREQEVDTISTMKDAQGDYDLEP